MIDKSTEMNTKVNLQLIMTYSIIIMGLLILFSSTMSVMVIMVAALVMMSSVFAILHCLSLLMGEINADKMDNKQIKSFQKTCKLPFLLLIGLPFVLIFEKYTFLDFLNYP